jgi:NAD(P)-dependent dehydrogenase (short-subunit alcohol dehydrogenase family)
MNLATHRVLVTGGAGGIGMAIAATLLERGAAVLLADRDPSGLGAAAGQFRSAGDRLGSFAGDLTLAADRARLVQQAASWRGGIDVLVNNAGINPFGLLQDQTAAQVDLSFAVNVQAPIQLCRELLPHLRSLPAAHIVNMGSVFGSIGFPGYAVYSATKFAMRGFSEALGRELADTGVRVHCLAPRATRTRINSPEVERMNAELGVAMDDPAVVGAALCAVLGQGNSFSVVGWPEKLFARVNAVLPRLVDGALRKQLPIIRRYAAPKSPAAGETP